MSAAPIQVRCGSETHPGLRRPVNEDALLAAAPVFVVADGMGGHDAGDRASAAVVGEFAEFVGRASVGADEVRDALALARTRVDALAGDGRSAGTTLTGVVICDVDGVGYWLAVNIGDSRTYRFSHGVLEQITVDHSVVQELIAAGELDAASAAADRRRNEITRAIGAGSTAEPDFWWVPAELGDRVLVCSDGLSGELDGARLAAILAQEADPQHAATRLVREALLAGGRDNITAVVVDAVAVSGDAELADTIPVGALEHGDEDTRPRVTGNGGQE
ncbi:PP2C family protein-serine/threonine phosphatase [Microbacterium sp.]|uniref:PP2C family protein-serine/threonine phosphatase n=1 Tax=Microbacterium sp. TaxID=51671 RepID=UPI003A8C4F8D